MALWGPPSRVQIPFCPHVLFLRNRLHSAPLTFRVPIQLQIWEGRESKKQSRKNSISVGQGPSHKIYITVSLSSSAGTKAPTQVEDGYSRLSATVLEYCPVTSLSNSQKKFTGLQPLSQILPKKPFP